MIRSLSSILFILLLLFLLPGCGKKTMPVAPQTIVPERVTDLGYTLDEKGVTLSWTFPNRTVEGKRLYVIEGFEVVRAVVAEDAYCEGCSLHFGPPVAVSGGKMPAGGARKKGSYTESLLRPQHRYFYKVRATTSWNLPSRDSHIISFVWETPTAAPTAVTVTVGDNMLDLSWQPPTTFLDGAPLSGSLSYEVFRSRDGKGFRPVSGSVSKTSYQDLAAKNDEKYSYKVRAVRHYKGSIAAGVASQVVSGIPSDRTPPVPPRAIKSVKIGKDIKISWASVPDKDLGGYRIYRRKATSKKPERIGSVAATATTFIDRKPATGTVYYSVTAYDHATPPNESTFSRETKAH